MMLFKRIPTWSARQNYCRMCRRSLSAKYSETITETTQESPHEDDLLTKYQEKLIYNCIVESRKLKRGYIVNKIITSKQDRLEEKLRNALRTIQPLPISLKYLGDNVQHTTSEEPEDDTNNLNTVTSEETHMPTNYPYTKVSSKVEDVTYSEKKEVTALEIKAEMEAKKDLLDRDKENWMSYYENYAEEDNENQAELVESSNENINYGTPNPEYPVSNTPCGGCGAYLHCQDTSIPGYIPSEIYKNSLGSVGASLQSILCQRCHFLKEYNIALQVRVSPEDYPKVLQAISFSSGMALLLVDLTDFPCSIWPGLADIVGPKTPIVVVGNKVDLLPKDDKAFLKHVKEVLINNLKINGFGSSRIKHIELISAKTGYGVESLITALHEVKRKGDLFIIGCTNVGKSTLFNLLLKSDFCKVQAENLIQRATTSVWPGTTLNLLKFPITNFTAFRVAARQKRLQELKKIEDQEQKMKREALGSSNRAVYATLTGHVDRSFKRQAPSEMPADSFTTEGRSNLTGLTTMGINDQLPEFVHGKWCYDTPGVVHPDQMLHLLTTEELVRTLPKALIRPATFGIKPGTSLFIAGLARLDYVDGPKPIKLTVFRGNSLPITVCKMEDADSVYADLVGSELMGVPIFQGDRADNWPGLELAKTFKVFGKAEKISSYDVVLSSAGWIAITCGWADHHFQAWTPQKRGVHVRDCLLPNAVNLRGAKIRHSVAYRKHRFI